jgi:hypothetical protein
VIQSVNLVAASTSWAVGAGFRRGAAGADLSSAGRGRRPSANRLVPGGVRLDGDYDAARRDWPPVSNSGPRSDTSEDNGAGFTVAPSGPNLGRGRARRIGPEPTPVRETGVATV